ncbi:MAG: hypothetical protein HUU54_10935 [Ignavibacteriaceae bacterium]|nr:hypothetical protein [Ignavibacteriaceae bacterium]
MAEAIPLRRNEIVSWIPTKLGNYGKTACRKIISIITWFIYPRTVKYNRTPVKEPSAFKKQMSSKSRSQENTCTYRGILS